MDAIKKSLYCLLVMKIRQSQQVARTEFEVRLPLVSRNWTGGTQRRSVKGGGDQWGEGMMWPAIG